MASRSNTVGRALLACLIGSICNVTHVLAEKGEGHSHKSPPVLIASPVQGFATNAKTLQVNVRFDARHLEEGKGQVAQLRLWLDGRLVAFHDIPHKVSQGAHTFAVDVSTHPDAIVHLQAGVVLEDSHKESERRREVEGKRYKDTDRHIQERREVRSPKVLVVLDKTPPVVTIFSPLGNPIVATPSIDVRGSVADKLSGLRSLSVNGTPTSAVHGVFHTRLALPFSLNPITIVATDRAGNAATIQRSVIQSSRPTLGPVLLSIPPTAALVGKTLQYQIVAASANPASLAFSIPQAPAGMALDVTTGLISWTPGPNQTGDQVVTVVATDTKGQVSQSFTLSVFGSRAVATAFIRAATGGVITVNDPTSTINELSINIPAGALAADTTINVSELITPSTLGGTSRFFLRGLSIEPDGALLAAQAAITLPYSASQFKQAEGIPLEDFLGTYFLDTSTGRLEGLASFGADTVNQVVTGSVPHFSTYVFSNVARLCAPPTAQFDCPNPPSTFSSKIPAIMIHGFQPSGMGDETTWGKLRFLLNGLDAQSSLRIDAWRFDWDSAHYGFERSAANLARAIAAVKQRTSQTSVNLVAHSFGGILARTYLQDMADFGLRYRDDVNRLMTLGTPHQGVGGTFSTLAELCSSLPPTNTWPETERVTCFQANTGFPILPGDGQFLTQLNSRTLPQPLSTTVSPQYHVIRGRLLSIGILSNQVKLEPDDGLITLAGSDPCPAGHPQLCRSDMKTEIIASSETDAVGLCHSPALFSIECTQKVGSNGQSNVAMAEVNDKAHPLWEKICEFLGADQSKCRPQLTVSLSDPLGGIVTSDLSHPGINCGTNCSSSFDSGTTIILFVRENAGYRFTGWSGACFGTSLDTTVVIADDRDQLCTANFILVGTQAAQVFTNPAAFNAATANLGARVVVDFNGLSVPFSDTYAGRVPFDGNTFAADGIRFSNKNGFDLYIAPGGLFWNESNSLSVWRFPFDPSGPQDQEDDDLTIAFNPSCMAAGVTLVDNGSQSPTEFVDFLDTAGVLIQRVPLPDNFSGFRSFVGLVSPTRAIGRIEISEDTNDGDDVNYDDVTCIRP